MMIYSRLLPLADPNTCTSFDQATSEHQMTYALQIPHSYMPCGELYIDNS